MQIAMAMAKLSGYTKGIELTCLQRYLSGWFSRAVLVTIAAVSTVSCAPKERTQFETVGEIRFSVRIPANLQKQKFDTKSILWTREYQLSQEQHGPAITIRQLGVEAWPQDFAQIRRWVTQTNTKILRLEAQPSGWLLTQMRHDKTRATALVWRRKDGHRLSCEAEIGGSTLPLRDLDQKLADLVETCESLRILQPAR